jgi:hypothetical protein
MSKVLYQSTVHGKGPTGKMINKGKPKKFPLGRNEGSGDTTGVGGERRRRKIDEIVDKASGGKRR